MGPSRRKGSTSNSVEGEPEFRRVIVLGAGAIGSLYGALLSRRVHVLLIGRRSHVDAISSGGLIVSGGLAGRFDVEASTELDDVPEGTLILLTTKAQDSGAAVAGIAGLLGPGRTILVLQNGLGNEELVRRLLGEEVEVVRGLATCGVEFLEPGRIAVRLVGETVLPQGETGARIKRLFDACGLETRLSGRMEVELWRKLTLNCVVNPLTALLGVPNREVAAEILKEIRRGVVEECVAVARAEGVELGPSILEEVTAAAASYPNLSSMRQDAVRGRRTEIDFLNGRVSELGRRHGVETPVNDTLAALVKFMEERGWRSTS